MAGLETETFIAGHEAEAIFSPLAEAHRDHATLSRQPGKLAMRHAYGEVFGAADGRGCRISLRAGSATHLSYLKMAVAWPLVEAFGSDFPLAWSGEDRQPLTPSFFREARVIASTRIAPHMKRIRFALAVDPEFANGGLHARILLPPAGRSPRWPTLGGNGLLVWPQGEDALTVRVYTLRSIDAERGTVDIDFVAHPGGSSPGADFALSAQAGDLVGILGPGGGGVPQASEVLLFGDDTALPAIARILKELPADARARAFIEVDGQADRQPLSHRCGAEITWLHRDGKAPGTAGLLGETLRGIDPASLIGDAFVWAGCEFSDFRAIRSTLRKEWRLAKERHMVVAYWRRGAQGELAGAAD